MPGGVPLQSPRVLPAGRPLGGRLRLPEVPLPFDDVPRSGPVCSGPSGSATVPTPGFLTPSPVSWLRSSLRVCCAPLPSLGSFSLQSVPLASGRAPLVGAAGSLAVLPGRTPVRRTRSCHLRPSPTRATFGRRPWPDPAEARGSLSASRRAPSCDGSLRYASRSPWTSHAGLTSARSFRRLRSVLPCASPFTPRDGHPSRGGRCSPGRSRPSRALLPPSLGPSTHPPRPEASLLPLVARASRRVARLRGSPCDRALLLACATSAPLLETLDVGWNRVEMTESSRAEPSAVTGPFGPGRAVLGGRQPRLP